MGMDIVLPSRLAEEGHRDHSGHVEPGDTGRENREAADDRAPLECRVDDLILRPEPRERRNSDDRQVAGHERDEGDAHRSAQRAVAPHVHVVMHSVHHRTGAEEEPCLEHTMREEVEDCKDIADGPEPCGHDHVSDLAHRRACERLLDVVLRRSDDGAHEDRDKADDDYRGRCPDCPIVDRIAPGDEVDAGRDHGRCVDKG